MPSFSRVPSAPGFQPALLNNSAALAMLKSKEVSFETNCPGLLRMLAVALPVRP
jgi:hypothetical protein